MAVGKCRWTWLSCAVALGCGGITEVRTIPRPNPMAWAFASPFASVAQCMESVGAEPVVDRWGNRAELDRYGDEPEKIREDNRYDLNLESAGYGRKAVHSEVYLFKTCPLGLYGHWRVRAVARDAEHTRVDVVPKTLHVHNYRCFYIGHPWGCALAVEPSTIEEYRILLALGACLGTSGMPAVVTPSGPVPLPTTCEGSAPD